MLFQLDPSTNEPYYSLPSPHENFRLTPLRESDAPHIIEILNDPAVSPYMTAPFPFLAEHAERFMLRFKGPQDDAWTAIKATSNPLKLSSGAYEYEGIPPNGTCPVRILREVITNPEDGTESEQFAGDFGFMRNSFYEIEDDAEREKAVVENESKDMGDPCIVWSFGYMLHPSYHGQGLMSALLNSMFTVWAIPHLRAQRIVATVFSDNIGSQKVMLKNGMKYVGSVGAPEGIALRRRKKGRDDSMLWVYEWRAGE